MFLVYVGSLTLVIHIHDLLHELQEFLYMDLKDILHMHIQAIVDMIPLSKIDPY